jgi:hypothetical protein
LLVGVGSPAAAEGRGSTGEPTRTRGTARLDPRRSEFAWPREPVARWRSDMIAAGSGDGQGRGIGTGSQGEGDGGGGACD